MVNKNYHVNTLEGYFYFSCECCFFGVVFYDKKGVDGGDFLALSKDIGIIVFFPMGVFTRI